MPPVAFQLPPKTPASGNTASATAAQRLLRKPAVDRPAANSFDQQLTKIAARSDQRAQDEAPARADRADQTDKPSRTDRTSKKAKAVEANRKSQQRDEEEVDEVTEVDKGTKAQALPTIDDQATAEGEAFADDESASADSDQSPADEATVDPTMLLQGTSPAATPAAATPTDDAEVAPDAIAAATGEAGDGTTDEAMERTTVAGQAGGLTGAAAIADEAGAAGEQPAPRPGDKPATGVSGLGGKPADRSRSTMEENDEALDAQMTDGAPGEGASPTATAVDTSAVEQFAELFAPADASKAAAAPKPAGETVNPSIAAIVHASPTTDSNAPERTAAALPPAEVPPDTEARFAAANHAKIVSDVRGALMPNGGSMQLKLDPPELGPMQVSLHIKEGIVTASFQTQNPEAARLLSHTLSDLRSSLEAQGVTVDKLHVQQAPKDESPGNNAQGGDRQNQSLEQQQDSKREQQRKQMVQRLWDQLAGKAPIDLMA